VKANSLREPYNRDRNSNLKLVSKLDYFASFLKVSKRAKVDFPVRYPQSSPGLIARVFPFFSMFCYVNARDNCVEISAVNYRAQQFGFCSWRRAIL